MIETIKSTYALIPRQPGEQRRSVEMTDSTEFLRMSLRIMINDEVYTVHHDISILDIFHTSIPDTEKHTLATLCKKMYKHLHI